MNGFQNDSFHASARLTNNNAAGETTLGPLTYGVSPLSPTSFPIPSVAQPTSVKPSDLGPFPGFEDDRSNS